MRWEVREKFHSCICGERSPLLPREPRTLNCGCVVPWLGQIEAQLNSIKLAPIWEICLTKPWKLLWTCLHWFCFWNLLRFDEKAASTCRWKGFPSSILKREDEGFLFGSGCTSQWLTRGRKWASCLTPRFSVVEQETQNPSCDRLCAGTGRCSVSHS